jgi:hypothetical protein
MSSDKIDWLDEDSIISNQKFFVLSYLVPKDHKTPMVKVRGVYSTIDECKSRIKKLQQVDKYFHMFICEVGKWGALMTQSELDNIESLDVEYQNSQLNEIMKKYKENKEQSNIHFEERKERMKQQAEEEGTVEGQLKLKNKKEHPIAVKMRIKESEEAITELTRQIEELKLKKDNATVKLEIEYTKDEVEKGEEEFSNHEKNMNLKIE